MTTENKRCCQLTEEGLATWSKHNIEPDPRQVFTIEYQAEDHVWLKVWWGETGIVELDMVKEVFWDEDRGDYFEV